MIENWLIDHHVPLKEKTFRANNAQYITKKLRKAIMKRSQPKKNHGKMLTENSLKAYQKQNNYVGRFYKKEREILMWVYNSMVSNVVRSK